MGPDGKKESNSYMGDKVLGPMRVVNDTISITCKAQGHIPHSTLGRWSQLAGVESFRGTNLREKAPAGPDSRV